MVKLAVTFQIESIEPYRDDGPIPESHLVNGFLEPGEYQLKATNGSGEPIDLLNVGLVALRSPTTEKDLRELLERFPDDQLLVSKFTTGGLF